MPIFELNEKQWYQGMWRADVKGGDFLAFMWLEDGLWYFRYRFRYYRDRKTWDSNDEKHCEEFTCREKPGAKEKMFALIQDILGDAARTGGFHRLEYFPCCGTEVEMMRIIENIESGVRIQRLTEEEAKREGIVLPKKLTKKKA